MLDNTTIQQCRALFIGQHNVVSYLLSSKQIPQIRNFNESSRFGEDLSFENYICKY